MKNGAWMNKNSGMTLVELLVAMVVGLILLGGVYVSFVSSTTTNSMNEQLSRMQENGRFAMEVLTRELRGAGYTGCNSSLSIDHNINVGHPGAPDPADFPAIVASIMGWYSTDAHESGSPLKNTTSVGAWLPSGAPVLNVVTGTDFFQVIGPANDNFLPILEFLGSPTQFVVPENHSINADEWVLVSNCSRAIWVGICGFSNASNIQNSDGLVLASACGNLPPGQKNLASLDGGEIMKLTETTFFIGKRDADDDNPPALFMRSGGNTNEIVEGVESMQIRYGEDNSGDRTANVYVTANNVTEWNNVVSVRIGLLLRSPNELLRSAPDINPYNVNGTYIDAPGDRHLRLVMNKTVAIRNRLP